MFFRGICNFLTKLFASILIIVCEENYYFSQFMSFCNIWKNFAEGYVKARNLSKLRLFSLFLVGYAVQNLLRGTHKIICKIIFFFYSPKIFKKLERYLNVCIKFHFIVITVQLQFLMIFAANYVHVIAFLRISSG